MALTFDGGVVMAADTRTSTGDYVANRASRKISKVHDKIFVCRCGSAADTQALTGFVINYLGQHAVELGKLPTVNTAASSLQLISLVVYYLVQEKTSLQYDSRMSQYS